MTSNQSKIFDHLSSLSWKEAEHVFHTINAVSSPKLQFPDENLSSEVREFFQEWVQFSGHEKVFIDTIWAEEMQLHCGPIQRTRLCDRDFFDYVIEKRCDNDPWKISRRIRHVIDRSTWKISPKDKVTSPRGLAMENPLLNQFGQQYDVQVKRCGMVARSNLPICATRPDGLIFKDGRFVGAVEVKCPFMDCSPLQYVQNPDLFEWTDDGYVRPIGVHAKWWYQLQLQMMVMGLNRLYLIIARKDWKVQTMVVVRIKRDEDTIRNMNSFFHDHFFNLFLYVAHERYCKWQEEAKDSYSLCKSF